MFGILFRRWRFSRSWAGLLLGLLCVAGCETPSQTSGPRTGRFVVNTSRTAFYKYGPAQAMGPDFALYKGQQVTMLKRDFGYSQVATADGQSGYVATDDLLPAPPEPSPTPSPKLAKNRGGSRRYEEIENAGPSLSLPERTPEPTSPNRQFPSFRY